MNALTMLLVPLAVAAQFPGTPIWSSNASSSFSLFRSPAFSLRGAPLSATLFFTALGSPGTRGTLQAKLLGAACPYLNGLLLTCGPGHNVPTNVQQVRAFDLLPYLRQQGDNVLGVVSYYNQQVRGSPAPRMQAWVDIVDADGNYTLIPTGSDWASALNGDAIYGPSGEAGVSWYHFPNEDLDRRSYPLGWSEAGFAQAWPPAALRPAFSSALALSSAPAPVLLQRKACQVTQLAPNHCVLDFGQEFMGGVNLTFVGAAEGAKVRVILGEVLRPDSTVMCPAYTGNQWNSTWTLAGNPALDASIAHHEFVQFRVSLRPPPPMGAQLLVKHVRAPGTTYLPPPPRARAFPTHPTLID